MTDVSKLVLSESIEREALHTLHVIGGLSTGRAQRVLDRWKAWDRASIPACRYGVKDQPRAVDCKCEGCLEKISFLFLDNVRRQFGVLPPR